MGKMSELAAELAELKRCGEVLIGISETLTEMFSGVDAEPAAETKEEEVKEQAVEKKAAAVKKPAAKKTAEPEATVTIQFQGKSIAAKDVVEMAKNAFAQANPDVQIKTIDIYVKPEENTAYYAVNGQGSEDYKVEL